jgi:hypothetical protein
MSISRSFPVKRSAYHFCVWPRYLPPQAWPTMSRGEVVAEPVRDFTEPLDRTDVGLLVEFAQAGRPRILADERRGCHLGGLFTTARWMPDVRTRRKQTYER